MIKGRGFVATFGVWDTQANTGKSGESANLTLYVVKDGIATESTNSPTDIGNGRYSIDITNSENDSDTGEIHGVCSTESCEVIPTIWQNWEGSYIGRGASQITLYIKDGSTVFSGIQVYTVNGLRGVTGSGGEVVFSLDDGTYTFYLSASPLFSAESSYTIVVADGVLTSPSGGILTVTTTAIPAPISPGVVGVYSDEYNPNGVTLVGTDARRVYVVSMETNKYSPEFLAHFQPLGDKDTAVATNDSGRWYMELPADSTIIIRIYDVASGKSEGWKFETPSSGVYSLWQLSPVSVYLTQR